MNTELQLKYIKESEIMLKKDILNSIIDVPDYPKKGVTFKDLTPILNNADYFNYVTSELVTYIKNNHPATTHIAAPESRGFWFGCAVAAMGCYGFVPFRKPGKLPRECTSVSFDLEYGKETLCVHTDALSEGDSVFVIDDVLATGGTLHAMEELIYELGVRMAGSAVVLELTFLKGRKGLTNPLFALFSV